MSDAAAVNPERDEFDRLLEKLRPKLHRYCARMTGSVIDGEDVLQEALVKAIEAFGAGSPVKTPKAGCSASPTMPRSTSSVRGRVPTDISAKGIRTWWLTR
jgi:Sigma-70 region 2